MAEKNGYKNIAKLLREKLRELGASEGRSQGGSIVSPPPSPIAKSPSTSSLQGVLGAEERGQ
jgi:hypothetical protein